MFRHKARTTITLTAVAFGTVALILSGGFLHDIFIQLGEAIIHSQTGHIQIGKRGAFSYGSRSSEKYLIADAEGEKLRLASVPGVVDVMARINFSGLLNNGRTDFPIVAEGIEPDREAALGTSLAIVEGRQLFCSRPDRVAARRRRCECAEVKARGFGHVGGVDSRRRHEHRRRRSRRDLPELLQGLRRACGEAATESRAGAPQHERRQSVGDVVVSNTGHHRRGAAAQPRLGFAWSGGQDLERTERFLFQDGRHVRRLLRRVPTDILVMVLLSVANAVNMSVLERVGEFGTMRALGNRRNDIARLVLTESVILATFGAAIGVVAGVALALIISAVGIPMPPPPNANLGYTGHIRIVASVVGSAIVIAFAATVVACVPAAVRVSRISIVEALRRNV